MFSSIWSIFLIVLFFGGSIFVHELGHFLAARRRGVKVTRFSIGFGPAIWKWHGRDGVEYRLSWIPLGGYVALPQLADMAAIEGGSDVEAEKLPPISYNTKFIVFVAGAAFNVIFAFALATILWFAGRPAPEYLATTRIGYVLPTLKMADGADVPSPAVVAGLKANDIIRKVDGRAIEDWNQFKSALVLGTGTQQDGKRLVHLTIERDGQLLEVTASPQKSGDERFRTIGISPAFATIIDQVLPGSPSAATGFLPKDQIVAVEGQPVAAPEILFDYLRTHKDRPVRLTVMRQGQSIFIMVPPVAIGQPHPLSGLTQRINYSLVKETPWLQIGEIVDTTFRTLWSLVSPKGDLSFSNLSGPLGIGRGFWNAGQSDFPFRYALWFAVLINVNLAIFNLLPIPVLDGGHMLLATITKLRGRPLPANFILSTQSVFMVLLLMMVLYVTIFGDIRRLVSDFKADTQAKEAAAAQQKKAAEAGK
ncbi:MAG: RIP metalloprotease RseP [Opitutae bacterium]|nr:RIP metalloprotease RseP [Opitutae bacterium]